MVEGRVKPLHKGIPVAVAGLGPFSVAQPLGHSSLTP